MYPDNYQYSREHEWVRVEDQQATIGITEYAQQQLGEVVYVECPEVGASFGQGEEMSTIESVKAVAEYHAVISGTVIAANEAARDDPELLNEDPHGEGWLVKLQVANSSELTDLMSAEQYESYIKSGEA